MVRSLLAIVALVVVVPSLVSIDLDRDELESVSGVDLVFESYTGPVDQFDTAEEIRGIGRALADGVLAGGTGTYAGKYRAQRILEPNLERAFAADIVEFLPDASVDHIDNVRRILAGYLERAWGYVPSDADLVARFVTLYNAVYRGEGALLERYRSGVARYVDVDHLGLALSFREWPGGTQLIIPLSDGARRMSLGAVEPRELLDPRITARLRERFDRGVPERKELIEFIERVIEESIAESEERLVELDEREAALPAVATEETPAAAAETPSPPSEPLATQPESDPEPAVDTPAEAEAPGTPATQSEAAEPEPDEVEAARQEIEEEIAATEELVELVQEAYQETAADQEELIEQGIPSTGVALIIESGGYELVAVNPDSAEQIGVETVAVASRSAVRKDATIFVVSAGSRHLLRIDTRTLEVTGESSAIVAQNSPLVEVDSGILAVVIDDGTAYIGLFDETATLRDRSSAPVMSGSDVVVFGDSVYVHLADGSFGSIPLPDITGR